MTLKGVARSHPLLTFYGVAFLISWGGILAIVGATGRIPASKAELDAQLPLAIPAMLSGPSLAAFLTTWMVDGTAGLRGLVARLTSWRVALGWYVGALVTAPLVGLAIAAALSLVSPAHVPGIVGSGNWAPRVVAGLAAGLVVGLCEELGWTGFVVPRLRQRHSVVATGLVVGLLWGAWHILSQDVWAYRATTGDMPPSLFMALRGGGLILGGLLAFRILMVWVYDRTHSLPVVIVMHAGLTASALILEAPVAGGSLLLADAVTALTWWVVVVVVLAASRLRSTAPPPPRHAS